MTCGWLTCFRRVNSDSRSRSSLWEAFSVAGGKERVSNDETIPHHRQSLLIYHHYCLARPTFKHFHSHSGVTSFSFQPERRRLDNFSELAFTQSLAKYKVFTRKLPLWILLLNKDKQKQDDLCDFKAGTLTSEEKQPTGILKVSVSMDSCEPRRTLLAGKLMG